MTVVKVPGLIIYDSPQHGPILTHPRWWWSAREILRRAGRDTHRISDAARLAHNAAVRDARARNAETHRKDTAA